MTNTATIEMISCPEWCTSTVHIDNSDHVGKRTELPAWGQSDALSLVPSMTADGDTVILVSVDGGDSETTLTRGQTRAFIAAMESVLLRVCKDVSDR